MEIVPSANGAVNGSARPAPKVLQTILVRGAALRLLMRTAGLRTTDPSQHVAIIGCGPRFAEVSSFDWMAGCDDLTDEQLQGLKVLPDIRGIVRALTAASFIVVADCDDESASP